VEINNTKVIKDSNFRNLYETEKLIAGNIFEYAYLFDKVRNATIDMGDFYGDPYCALIDVNNQWCLIGGEHICAWNGGRRITKLINKDLKWILQMRQTGPSEAELLVEGDSDANLSVWRINVKSLMSDKISEIERGGDLPEEMAW
jgi:hypothetical protein